MAHVVLVRCRGFKSVGDAWLDVRIGTGLNAIAGANGCGKTSLLDAILFACAAPMPLASIANSDCSEVCEVCVQLQDGRGAARQTHTVQAVLTPDGSRSYKVDGRARSGKEVRQFLRALGVCLHSGTAVIKQARVTSLADSASPADLAAVVAEASGLGRWNEEVAAATDELRRTCKALGEVQASLAVMEEAVAADGAKLRACDRLHQLEHDAATLAQQLAGMLQAALSMCNVQAAAAADAVAVGMSGVEHWQREVETMQQTATSLQQTQEEHAATSGESDMELLRLQEAVAIAEEELRLLSEQQQRHSHLQQRLQQALAAVERLAASHSQAAAELAACRQAQCMVASDLQRASSAAELERLRAKLKAEARQLEEAVAARAGEVTAAASAVQRSKVALQQLQAEQLRLAAAAAAAAGNLPAVLQQRLASLEGEIRLAQNRCKELQGEEERVQAEAGTLAARLASAARTSAAAHGPAWRPLHRCFSVRDPQYCQQFAIGLNVLAGGKLGVIVADSLGAAEQLLAAGSSARIWPLDSLCIHDQSQQQLHAVACFSSGLVVLPADLLRFEESHRPAILRAFGSHVIAATDQVAEQLITRFGIPSVTPDGKGGWRGGGGNRQTLMHLKILLAAAEQRQAALHCAAEEAAAALAEKREQLGAVHAAVDAAETASSEAAAAEGEAQACQLALRSQQAAHVDASARMHRSEAELAAKIQLLEGLLADCEASAAGQPAQAALRNEDRRLEAAAAGMDQRVAALAAELAAASAEVAAAEADCMLYTYPPEAEAGARMAEGLAKLAVATTALGAKQAQLAAHSAALHARAREQEHAARQLASAKAELAEAEAAAKQAQAAGQQAAKVTADVQQQLSSLLREVPELEAALHQAPAGSACPDQSLPEVRQAAAHLARQRSKLLAERKRSSAASLSLSEQLHYKEQQERLASRRQQAATLEMAVQRLQEGICSAGDQVVAVNEAVFVAIDTSFQSLIQAMLPAYRFRLRKVGDQVHEGVQLEFAHRPAAGGATSGAAGSGWRSGLDCLSGGQRTLVTLTLVVAAAMAGESAALLLMDEVDAALDEANQALVARLFGALIGGSGGARGGSATGCRQVICVSHNAAFQRLCQHVVRLTKGHAGTQLAEGGGAVSGSSLPARAKRMRSK